MIGASLEFPVSDKISIIGNLNYERRVSKFVITSFNSEAREIGDESFREIFTYLNFPILLKYQFTESGYFCSSGPFFNYIINDKFKPEYENADRRRENSTDLRNIDFGISLGIGKVIELSGSSYLTIEIRDDFGIADTGGVPNQFEGASRTNSVKLILNWAFSLQ